MSAIERVHGLCICGLALVNHLKLIILVELCMHEALEGPGAELHPVPAAAPCIISNCALPAARPAVAALMPRRDAPIIAISIVRHLVPLSRWSDAARSFRRLVAAGHGHAPRPACMQSIGMQIDALHVRAAGGDACVQPMLGADPLRTSRVINEYWACVALLWPKTTPVLRAIQRNK